VDVDLEATSGEDAADLARVIADVPIAIETRLEFNRHPPGTGIMTAGGRSRRRRPSPGRGRYMERTRTYA